jgi:hypothetical protein
MKRYSAQAAREREQQRLIETWVDRTAGSS